MASLDHISHPARREHLTRAGSAMGALGIVYGDIGTSPLYAYREAVTAAGSVAGGLAEGAIFGALSLALWTLILVISIKYCVFLLKADNHGEGGILALIALAKLHRIKWESRRKALLIMGLIGAAMLYGDGAITPAISVLSALEGVAVAAPALDHAVLPATLLTLTALFLLQRLGTARIGRLFGPVMLIWFLVLGILGVGGILQEPRILAAISPLYGARYLLEAGPAALKVLGGVFLVVTGGEALYADMGHFGRKPIRLAWFTIALPGLALNYFGQGALLLRDPAAVASPFYLLAPPEAHWPLVALAVIATVIASQAIITGIFSISHQAIQLGFLPRMRVVQTSRTERGQIYMPVVNWVLAAATLGAVIGFGSSAALAGAYGMAVSLLMAITTVLAGLVALRWKWPRIRVYALVALFLAIDLAFIAANLTKIGNGGWFPLLLAAALTLVMLSWRWGQHLVENIRSAQHITVNDLVDYLRDEPPARIPGLAAFMSRSTRDIPLILLHHLRHNRVLHEQVFLISIVTTERPRMRYEERAETIPVIDGITRVILYFGFMERPDVPWGLIVAAMAGQGPDIDPTDITYYLGHESVIATRDARGFAQWHKTVYAFLRRNAELSAAYFGLPVSRVIEVGMPVEI